MSKIIIGPWPTSQDPIIIAEGVMDAIWELIDSAHMPLEEQIVLYELLGALEDSINEIKKAAP